MTLTHKYLQAILQPLFEQMHRLLFYIFYASITPLQPHHIDCYKQT